MHRFLLVQMHQMLLRGVTPPSYSPGPSWTGLGESGIHRAAEKRSSRKLKTPGTVRLRFASALPSLYVFARLAAFLAAAPAFPSAVEGLSVELVRCSFAPDVPGCHLASEPSSRRFRQLGHSLTIFLIAKTLTCAEGAGCLSIHSPSEKAHSRKLPACAATSSCSRYLLPLCAVLILLFEKLFLVLLLGTLLLLAALLPLGLLFLKCLNFLLLLF